MRWSERPPAARSNFARLKHLHCDRRSLSVAVAHLVLVRPNSQLRQLTHMNDEKKVPESFKTYEEGKHRRYTLLFAVNGGAFALAKFIADKDSSTASVGGLKLAYLCYGMALFTRVMRLDIFGFGQRLRRISF